MLPISSVSFYGHSGKVQEKFKNKKIRRIQANNKATELLAKNETATKVVKKKSKTKKILTTTLLTLGTIVGLAALGNSSSNFMATAGQKVDDYLLDKKWYKSFEKGLKTSKDKVSDFLFKNKNQTIKNTAIDLKETLTQRHAQPTLDMARGYGRGFSSIFGLTPVEVLRNSLTKIEKETPGQAIKSLEKLVGKEKAAEYFEKLVSGGTIADNKVFCEELTEVIAKNFGAKDASGKVDTKKLLNIFKDLQKGKVNNVDFSVFTQVKMSSGGIMGLISDWWPVNIIDNIGNKVSGVFGKKWNNIGRGNLGDSLVKFNAVNGTLAKTKAGSFIQQSITVPTESISNFVNDKSGMGVLLGLSVAGLYNSVQDTPKEKRASLVANDYLGTIASIAITTPLAFKTTYALASLKNLEGKNWLTKGLKGIGKFFGLGHNQIGLDGKMIEQNGNSILTKLGKTGGHILRFALIMFVFNSLFDKPIKKCIHKIFGKPYDPAEENKELQKQQVAENMVLDSQNIQYNPQYNIVNNSINS